MTTEFNQMREKLQNIAKDNAFLKTSLKETIENHKDEKVYIMKVIDEYKTQNAKLVDDYKGERDAHKQLKDTLSMTD